MFESRIGDILAKFIKEYAENDTSPSRAYTARWTSIDDAITKLRLDDLNSMARPGVDTGMPAPFRWIEDGDGPIVAASRFYNRTGWRDVGGFSVSSWQRALLHLGTQEEIVLPYSNLSDNGINYQRYVKFDLPAVSGTLTGKNGQPGTDEGAGGDQGGTVTRPTNLSYSPSTLTLNKGEAMTPVTPTVDGDAVESWTSSKALPNDLTIGADGTISGTPEVLSEDDYTITATNSAGSATVDIRIVVRDTLEPYLDEAETLYENILDKAWKDFQVPDPHKGRTGGTASGGFYDTSFIPV